MVRSLCGTNPNTLHHNSIMKTVIPEETKEMLEAHTKKIFNIFVEGHNGFVQQDEDVERDFMAIVSQLCRGAFIAGQKAAVEEMKELIK